VVEGSRAEVAVVDSLEAAVQLAEDSGGPEVLADDLE
jgi:hypothetical protein